MKRIKGITAIVLAGSLAFATAKPARSQAQLLAPAACATGIGCVLVGISVIGGIAYYVWQSNQTGAQFQIPVESNPRPLRSNIGNENYNIPGQREVHWGASADACKEMLRRFQREGRRLALRDPVPLRDGVLCIFVGPDAKDNYYNGR